MGIPVRNCHNPPPTAALREGTFNWNYALTSPAGRPTDSVILIGLPTANTRHAGPTRPKDAELRSTRGDRLRDACSIVHAMTSPELSRAGRL